MSLSRLVDCLSRLVDCLSRLVDCLSRLVDCLSRLVDCLSRLVDCLSRLVICLSRLVDCLSRLVDCLSRIVDCLSRLVDVRDDVGFAFCCVTTRHEILVGGCFPWDESHGYSCFIAMRWRAFQGICAHLFPLHPILGIDSQRFFRERRAHAPLPAGTEVCHGDSVVVTESHANRAAGRGCHVAACSASLLIRQ
jgi:hypothetical protein